MDRYRADRHRWLTVPEDFLGTLLLAAVFVIMVAGVFFRYVLNDSLIWSEELARYGLILLTFVGAATGFRSKSHIRIDLVDKAPPAISRIARLLAWLVSVAFLAFLVFQAVGLGQVLRASRSAALNIPVAWLYYAVAAMLAFGLIRLLQVGYLSLPGANVILLFGTLFALLAIGAPVFVAIGTAAAAYLLVNGINPFIAVQQMVAGVDSFPLLAVPFFILAGALMNAGAITERLYGFAHAAVGHWKGGLGHVNVYGSFIFSMMSGTAIADAGGLGQIEIKAMLGRGYPRKFAVGLSAASATLGPIIPPSLAMVVYGYAANVSVGQLFVAGIIPGILMAAALHLIVALYARRLGFPVEPKESWAERGRALVRSLPALMTPVIILGGILAGIMTPTEAAAVASVYALALATIFYRSLDLRGVASVWRETFETTALVLLMVSASVLFGWILVRENAASHFAAFMLALVSEPWHALIVLNVILLVAGMFLDTIAIILIAVPIFIPVIRDFGIDPVHFGVVMVINLMLGLLTPPIGLLLFVMSRIGGLDYLATFRACLPFLLPLAGVLLVVTFVPGLSLALPTFFFR